MSSSLLRLDALLASAAFVTTSAVLSLRFLTSSSQTMTGLNAAKPWLLVLLIAGLVLLAALVLRPPPWVRRILATPVLALALIAGFTALNFYLHPLLDREALKLAGAGSDADDALIDAATRLLRGEPPYAAPTYRGNPISPGVGWVALNALWASHALFFVLTPLYLALLAGVVRVVSGSWHAANIVVLGHLGCLGFWELAPTHDLAALGLALSAGVVALFAAQQSPVVLAALSLLLGIVATARLPFVLLPALVAVLLRRITTYWAVIAVLGVGIAAALPLAFQLYDTNPYQPRHVLHFGSALLTEPWLKVVVVATLVVVILALARPARTLAGLCLRLWTCLIVPLGSLALGQLAAMGFETGRWEGANYLAPAFSFAVTAFALHFRHER